MIVHDIRHQFAQLYQRSKFVIDKSGVKTIEIINANFTATEPLIFGAVNNEYVSREIRWYEGQSLNVNDIPGGPPVIWKQIADKDGYINSNYGWCVFSAENNHQFANVVAELEHQPDSRRATMIYTRPEMWGDHTKNGRSDFMCTNTVQYIIRDGKIHAIVNMRSNDAIFGYRNDYAWQEYMLDKVQAKLMNHGKVYTTGDIYWAAGSLHVYERHFYLIDHFIKTNETTITKEEYDTKYNMA